MKAPSPHASQPAQPLAIIPGHTIPRHYFCTGRNNLHQTSTFFFFPNRPSISEIIHSCDARAGKSSVGMYIKRCLKKNTIPPALSQTGIQLLLAFTASPSAARVCVHERIRQTEVIIKLKPPSTSQLSDSPRKKMKIIKKNHDLNAETSTT